MQRKVRVSFLSLFLIAVVIAFGIAVAMRVRAYATAAASVTPAAATESRAADTNGAAPRPAAVTETEAEMTPASVTPAVAPAQPVAGATQTPASTSATTTNAATRAQRFRELLSQPLNGAPAAAPVQPAVQPVAVRRPPPAPAPVQPKPTLMQKIVAPIANALGIGSNTPAPAPISTPATTTTQPVAEVTSTDPTSDKTAPRLLGVEFSPPQVQDGQEAIIMITAVDDISGVASISGTVTSPSGKALQGFSVQKDPEVPTRFFGKVQIPLKAEEGTWRVNFISMRDNASNTANVHYNQGLIPPTAVLRVISSQPDSTPPTLRGVYVDRRQMKAGEKNVIHIEADDDKSGMKFASGVFQSPSHFARISFGCQKDQTDTQWACVFNTPTSVDCGEWKLEQVQLQDNANNMATIRGDNALVAAVKLNIFSDGCDSTPPALQSVTLDTHSVSNDSGAAVIFTATVTDEQSGISGVMAQAVGPGQGSGKWFSFTPAGDGTNIWTGRFEIPPSAAKGLWRLAFVQVLDKANNLKLYTQNDPQLQNATFEVR